MGYDASIKIKEEIADKYKISYKVTDSDVKKYKNLLIGVCMVHSGIKQSAELGRIYDDIHSFLSMYVNVIGGQWKTHLKETLKENDNEYNVCGWDYKNSSHEWTIDELIDYETEQLFLLCIPETPSPFDKDKTDLYYNKLDDVSQRVCEIEDIVWDTWGHEFFNEYKNKEDSEFEESY